MCHQLKTLLSIAGSDPTGGAGIQADIRVGISLGIHILTAITAVTAQNSHGIQLIKAVSPEVLKTQLQSLSQDVIPDAIKIGMIGSVNNLEVVVEFIHSVIKLNSKISVIVDPVIKATAGDIQLIDNIKEQKKLLELYMECLFPLSSVITPNIEEVSLFLGHNDLKSAEQMNSKAIVIKSENSDLDFIEDTLLINDSAIRHRHPKYKCKNLHGTGCAYSTFLASYMALGYSLEKAFLLTSDKMSEIISRSCDYYLGTSSYGPLNVNNYII